MNTMSKGIHILGDLQECDLSEFVLHKNNLTFLKEEISEQIKKQGLTELGNFYHFFNKNAVTAVIALAESHISFHTWPEDGVVNLDIFVCNYSKDQSSSAKNIFKYLAKNVFKCKELEQKIIYR